MNDRIDPHLEHALAALKTVPARSPQAASRGRARYLVEAARLAPVAGRRPGRSHGWRTSRHPFAMNMLASLLVVFALMAGGATAAYAAQDDLPGDLLYPIKTLGEDARLWFNHDPQVEIDLLLTFTQIRVQEMTDLAGLGVIPPAAVQARLEQQLALALQAAAGLDDASLPGTLQRLRTSLQANLRLILQAGTDGEAARVMAQVRSMLEQHLGLVEDGLSDPQGFRNAVRQGQEGIPLPSETPAPGDGSLDHPPTRTPGPQNTPPGGSGEQTPGPTGSPGGSEQTPGPTSPTGPQETPGSQGGQGGNRP